MSRKANSAIEINKNEELKNDNTEFDSDEVDERQNFRPSRRILKSLKKAKTLLQKETALRTKARALKQNTGISDRNLTKHVKKSLYWV